MKINYQKLAAFVLTTFILVVPILVFGQDTGVGDGPGGLVPCGNPGQDPCTYKHLFKLIANVIKFLLFTVAIPLCAVAIVWAGIVLVMSPSSSTAKGKVREILVSACFGLAVALASYLIVDTLLTTFTDESIKNLEEGTGVDSGIVDDSGGSNPNP